MVIDTLLKDIQTLKEVIRVEKNIT